jgi:hypothetical protein
MENYEQIVVLIIVFSASFITWKLVKDFYKTKIHMIFAHLISIATASFMLLSFFKYIPSKDK